VLPNLSVAMWELCNLGRLEKGSRFIFILPRQVKLPTDVEKFHIDLVQGIRLGQVKVVSDRFLPIGRIDERMWAMYLGPRDAETYMKTLGRDRFDVVRLLFLEVEHVDTKFIEWLKCYTKGSVSKID